jgi:hypothetical protein
MPDAIEFRHVTRHAVPGSEESPAPLFLWLLPLFGSALIPGLWWTSADSPHAFRPDLIATMTAFVAAPAAVLLLSLSRGLRKRIRWALGVTTVVVLVGFQWRAFTLAGERVADTTGVPVLSDVVPVLFAGALLWLAVRLAREWQFALVIAIAVAALVGVLAFSTFALVAPRPADLEAAPAASNAPDVLLLVLDGYGRADWLESEFGFDNSTFLEELASRGFDIASLATANYGHTYASVSTMLNLDYVFPAGVISDDAREQMRAALVGADGLIPEFRRAGYETVYLENSWAGSQCGEAVVWCVRDGLAERSLWNLGQMTILAPAFRMLRPRSFHTISADHLDSLSDYLDRQRVVGVPRLTFAHLLLPHVPLLLDADCTLHRWDELRSWGLERGEILAARRLNYVEQTRCVNSRVLDAVDTLIEANPEAIVMITADHGPASLLNPNLALPEIEENTIQERMRILSAYRLPGCRESFRADLTPVNGTRLVTNCALGSNLAPLRDQNLWAHHDAEGTVVDITSRVQN